MEDKLRTLYFDNLLEEIDFTQDARNPDEINNKVLVKYENISASVICLREGQQIDSHLLSGDACIQVLAGTGRFRSRDAERVVSQGTFTFIPAQLFHSIIAETDLALLLCLTHHDALPEFQQDSNAGLERLPAR